MRVRFWIKSDHGTNREAVVRLPNNFEEIDIKGKLESWCRQFGAWNHGENVVNYGYEVLVVERGVQYQHDYRPKGVK